MSGDFLKLNRARFCRCKGFIRGLCRYGDTHYNYIDRFSSLPLFIIIALLHPNLTTRYDLLTAKLDKEGFFTSNL